MLFARLRFRFQSIYYTSLACVGDAVIGALFVESGCGGGLGVRALLLLGAIDPVDGDC